jgi:hypothetical protein
LILTNDRWLDDHEGFPNAGNWHDRDASEPRQDEIEVAKERQHGNKRGPPSSPDEQPSMQTPKTNPHCVRREVDAEKLELHKGRLITHDLEIDATRPLTNKELWYQVELVAYKDKHCSGELQGSDTNLLIPAVTPPSTPSVNHNAMPTFTPTQSTRTKIKPQRRTDVYPDMPVVTELVVSALVIET